MDKDAEHTLVYFCGAACQANAWLEHSRTCRLLREVGPAPPLPVLGPPLTIAAERRAVREWQWGADASALRVAAAGGMQRRNMRSR